jgi:hypothetical protein
VQSLESFYADPRRHSGKELHFGLGWRTPRYEFFEFDVFWLEGTRELCALHSPVRDVRSDGPFSRFILGLPPHFRKQELRGEEVEVDVLALLDEDQVQDALGAWERHINEPDGYDWILKQTSSRA